MGVREGGSESGREGSNSTHQLILRQWSTLEVALVIFKAERGTSPTGSLASPVAFDEVMRE